ncbi:MAG TPA: hypothetical protein VJ398_00015 [Acidimicrobiia bacterium]|nr:hypothetical protein [Acidimicrobiia bacterium]
MTSRLDLAADAKTKAWWERYLKDVIEFRGSRWAGSGRPWGTGRRSIDWD